MPHPTTQLRSQDRLPSLTGEPDGATSSAHLRLITAQPTAATTPQDVLDHAAGCIDAFLAHRAASGSDPDTVRCERTTLTKFFFWLATGRLPARGYRGKYVFEAQTAEPGWTPLTPEAADADLVVDYRDALFEARTSEATRSREILQLGHYYTWLTGSKTDNPVARSKAKVKYRGVPTDTSTRHDSFYTAAEMELLLRASHDRVQRARAVHRPEDPASHHIWLVREVDHLLTYLLWGTGATAAAICSLAVTDLDLDDATVAWRTSNGSGPEETVVQPLPGALVEVLRDYLTRVRPLLGIDDDRLLVNPAALADTRNYRPRVLQALTKQLAQTAGLADRPGGHSPSRWGKSYAQRILDAPRGSLVCLMWLQGRRTWVGLERTYGTTKPQTSSLTIDGVYPHTASTTLELPGGPPAPTAAAM